MKRTVIALVLAAFICSVGFAEETDTSEFKYRTTSGGFWTSGQDFCGGFGEFGINCLPQEKNFVLCGWFPHTLGSTLIWFGVFVVVYIIIWICFTMYYRKKIKEINKAL